MDLKTVMDRLVAEVAEIKEVNQSAIALIKGMAEQIRANAANPEILAALADSLDTSANELGAAVVSHSPENVPAPAPPAEPNPTAETPAEPADAAAPLDGSSEVPGPDPNGATDPSGEDSENH